MTWTSTRKTAYDSIVARAPTPAEAVQIMIDFEAGHGLTAPLVYVSTAITSGGFRHDPRYSDPAAMGRVVVMNDAACARLMAVIADQPEPFVTVDNVMVPTELGAVPEWSDSHYLEFYFAWCAGLTGQAAEASRPANAGGRCPAVEPLLLQLVDVGYSLGCPAEAVMARGLGWEILTIAVGSTLTGAALADVQALRVLSATVGAVRQPIEIVPVDLGT